MSYLDNLESNLKALESREERTAATKRPEFDRNQAKAAQPYAEQLRKSDFTKKLLDRVVQLAHGHRTKVYISWSGNALRLDARERRLELQPTPEGIGAVFSAGYDVTARKKVDLTNNPEALAEDFVSSLPRAAANAE